MVWYVEDSIVFMTEDYMYKFLSSVSAGGDDMLAMRGRDQEVGMKGSVDIRYMIDVGVKGGVRWRGAGSR